MLKVKISFDTNAQDAQVLLDEVADLYDALTILRAHEFNNGYEVHIEAFDSAFESAKTGSTDRQASYVFNVSPARPEYVFGGEAVLSPDLSDLDVDKRLIKHG